MIPTATILPPDQVARAADLVCRIRRRVPHFGLSPLTEGDLEQLRAAVQLRIEVDSGLISDHIVVPTLGTGRLLLHRPDLPRLVRRFLVLREVCYGVSGRSTEARISDVVALVGLLDRASVLRVGEAWVSRRLRRLTAARPTWARVQLPVMVRSISAVLHHAPIASPGHPGASTDGDADFAFEVAVLARRRGDLAVARKWFVRSRRIARQSGDHRAAVVGAIAAGRACFAMDDLDSSETHFSRALREAGRFGLEDLRGAAVHELFHLSVKREDWVDAERYATHAMRIYGTAHPRLPSLANDVAEMWMLRGRFAPALRTFVELLPHFDSGTDERLTTLAAAARAAGGAGDLKLFQQLWDDAWAEGERGGSEAPRAAALLALAHGARSSGEWTKAIAAASAAASAGAAIGNSSIVSEAQQLLEHARLRSAATERHEMHTGSTPDRLESSLHGVLRARLSATARA